MRNRIGFVPKNAAVQPDYYVTCFNAACAVFIAEHDTQYHLQMVLDAWEWQNDYKIAKGIEILKQNPTCRVNVTGAQYKTIKSALEKIEMLLDKHKKDVPA